MLKGPLENIAGIEAAGAVAVTRESKACARGAPAPCWAHSVMEGLRLGSRRSRHQVRSINILWACEIFLLLEPRWIPKEN